MDCSSARALLPLYFDGELDRVTGREFEAHLDECPDCRSALIELDSLRQTLRSGAERYTAPLPLRERIQSSMTKSAAGGVRKPRTRWLAHAASLVLAFGGGGLAMMLFGSLHEVKESQLARDLFASHWRALAASSPVDVVSTDRHTVKPWFAGKVAQAPLVRDFADQGFALVGGRIDYVGRERVPVLVYRHGQHVIDVFVMPRSAASAVAQGVREAGYSLEPVTLGDQAAMVVSDLDASEATRLTALLSGSH